MDNPIFNVNGKTPEMLMEALRLVFMQDNAKASAWAYSEEHGLILMKYHSRDDRREISPFPVALSAEEAFPFVSVWLAGDSAKMVKKTGNDAPYDGGDVQNGGGWRIYREAWGHVGNYSAAICAIKPACLWYGK